MTKNEFAEHLRKQGYDADLEDGVVMALNAPFKKITREAKKVGFYASYGSRYTPDRSIEEH